MDVQNLEKNQRNKIIKELCDQGAGFRQLARITGISYGIIQRVVTDQSPLIYGSKLTVSNGNQTLVYTKYNGTPQHILQAMDFFNRQSVHLIVAANQMESNENK